MAKIEIREIVIQSPSGELRVHDIEDYDVLFDEASNGYDVSMTVRTQSAARFETRA